MSTLVIYDGTTYRHGSSLDVAKNEAENRLTNGVNPWFEVQKFSGGTAVVRLLLTPGVALTLIDEEN
jgi:hypothetical protein